MEKYIIFFLRLALIFFVWASIWRFIRPENQKMRLVRAAVLVVSMLFVFMIVRLGN